MKPYLLCVLLAGCAGVGTYPPQSGVYWDQPSTGWFWVADGVEAKTIIEAAQRCGAKVDGATSNHGAVPPGFSTGVFHFVDENSPIAQRCTVERLNAVPQLTTYFEGARRRR